MSEVPVPVPAIPDRVTVSEYYLALTLIYAGCPLVTVARDAFRHTQFQLVCPECDFEIYKAEYHAGMLQVSDIRAFGATVSRIGGLLKGLGPGETFYDPEYVHHFLDDGEGGGVMFESKTFKVERAWTGGPLRKVGSGNGSPSKYVCETCHKPTGGLYRTALGWVCQGCRTPKRSKASIKPLIPRVGGSVLRVSSPQVGSLGHTGQCQTFYGLFGTSSGAPGSG